MSTVETGNAEEHVEVTGTAEGETTTQQPPEARQPPDWVPRRMGELAAQRRAAEQRADQAEQRAREHQAELAALRAGGGAQGGDTTANVDQLARAYAQQLRDQDREKERVEREQQAQVNDFNTNLQAVQSAGDKEFGEDFKKSVDTLLMAGVGGQQFLQVVFEVPSPEKVIAYLGKPENVEEAIRVSQLSPTKMAVEMTKLASKAAKEMAKQVSKAPAPVETVAGSSGSGGIGAMPDPKDTKAWMAYRNKNARRK